MPGQDCSPTYKNRPPFDKDNPPLGGAVLQDFGATTGASFTATNSVPGADVIQPEFGPPLPENPPVTASVLTFTSAFDSEVSGVDNYTGAACNEIKILLSESDNPNFDDSTYVIFTFRIVFRDDVEQITIPVQKLGLDTSPSLIAAIQSFVSSSKYINVSVTSGNSNTYINPFPLTALSGGTGAPSRPDPYVAWPNGLNTGPDRSICIQDDELTQYNWDTDFWISFEPDADCRPLDD